MAVGTILEALGANQVQNFVFSLSSWIVSNRFLTNHLLGSSFPNESSLIGPSCADFVLSFFVKKITSDSLKFAKTHRVVCRVTNRRKLAQLLRCKRRLSVCSVNTVHAYSSDYLIVIKDAH